MKTPKCLVGLMIISMIALCARSAYAWDTRWQFKQDAPSNNYGSGSFIAFRISRHGCFITNKKEP